MYISVEKSSTPIFYVNISIWNDKVELEAINEGCVFRLIQDINNEGLRIENKIYRMYMKVKPKIRTFKRSIPILENEEELRLHLDILKI
jgi:hypothetical protein